MKRDTFNEEFEIVNESLDGQYVDADIAQSLYDALTICRDYMESDDDSVNWIDQILEKADKD